MELDDDQPDLRRVDPAFVVASTMFAAYCSALDSGTSDDLRRLLTDDVLLEVPGVTHKGVDAVVESYAGFFAASGRTTRHHLTNVQVLEAGDEITAEAYLLAVTSRDGGVSLASGSYRDIFAFVDGRWRIAHKRIDLAIPFTRLTNPGRSEEPHDPQR